MEAILLVGGLGTRLRSVVGELPKPLAPIDGRPFLAWVMDALTLRGIDRFILSVGYGADQIRDALGDDFGGTPIEYSAEDEPLGTGGAARRALDLAHGEAIWLLNGDTYCEVDLHAASELHRTSGTDLTMAIRHVNDTARFGRIDVEEGIAIRFQEKGLAGPGWINAGAYLLNRHALDIFEEGVPFSLENDWLVPLCSELRPRVVEAADYFIDIGIPESYAEAQRDLPRHVHQND